MIKGKNKSGFCFKYLWVAILIVFMVGMTFQLRAEEPLDNDVKTALIAIYDFRFHDADSLLNHMETNYRGSYLPHLVRAGFYWWLIISEDDSSVNKERYIASLSKAEISINTVFQNNSYYYKDIFHLINLYALKARLDLLNGNYLKALRHMKNCVDFIDISLGKEKAYPDFNLTSGLYNYLSDYGTRKYPFLVFYSLMYPRGNMLKGLEQLKVATQNDDEVIRTEAHYFLMKIYIELEKNYEEALYHASYLTEKHPGNLIFLYHYYQLLQLQGNAEMASEVKSDYKYQLKFNTHLSSRQKQYLIGLL
jgi:tetratricopeptide (TPR) repeat protein